MITCTQQRTGSNGEVVVIVLDRGDGGLGWERLHRCVSNHKSRERVAVASLRAQSGSLMLYLAQSASLLPLWDIPRHDNEHIDRLFPFNDSSFLSLSLDILQPRVLSKHSG